MEEEPKQKISVTNYELHIPSGATFLAGLMWLAFVATIFLLMLRVVEPDGISVAGLVLFFLLAVASSFSGKRV